MTNRDRYELIRDALRLLNDDALHGKTEIMWRGMMRNSQAAFIVDQLLASGMTYSYGKQFRITEKGKELLAVFEEMGQLVALKP